LKNGPPPFKSEKEIGKQEAEDQRKGVGYEDYIKGISDGFTEIDIFEDYIYVILKADESFFINAGPIGKAYEKRVKNRKNV
jgi:hypothetical protein